MARLSVILISTAFLVFGAGVMLGRVSAPVSIVDVTPASRPTTRQRGEPSWLNYNLHLRDDQKPKMEAIWSKTIEESRKMADERRALDADHSNAILKLLTPEQKAQYDASAAQYHKERDRLQKEREQLLDSANKESLALLDDSQKKIWDSLTRSQAVLRRGPGSRPSTRPTFGGDPERRDDRP